MLSIYVAVLSIATLLAMHFYITETAAQYAHAEATILSTSQKKFIDVNLKNAMRIAMRNAVGRNCEEKIANAALKLGEMESFVENFYSQRGLEVDGWSGWLDENNNCIACFDLETMQSSQVMYCDQNVKVIVSRSHVPLAYIAGKPAIGFTVKRGNDKWNSIAGEGFE